MCIRDSGGPENGGKNSAFRHAVMGRLREESPGNVSDAVANNVPQDQGHHRREEETRESRGHGKKNAGEVDPAAFQRFPVNLRFMRPTQAWPRRLIVKVKIKRRTPIKNSTW